MGWGRSAAFSHARRLEREAWIVRYPTFRGNGSLLVTTSLGVRMAGVAISPPKPPAPTWWAHLHACGWVAAWLTVRGRMLQGAQEITADDTWHGQLVWRDSRGQHKSRHRPDLAWLPDRDRRVGIEVELARKSTARLEAILGLHARWRAMRETAGVIYVCADQAGCERVRNVALKQGLSIERGGGLRVELLAVIEEQSRAAWSARTSGVNRAGDKQLPVRTP